MKHEIYTKEFVQAIKRQYTTALVKYIAIAVLFAALCVAFCLLAAFDLANVFVCCALNILFTIAFLWYSFLFFFVVFKSFKQKNTFVKCLENASPFVFQGVLEDCEREKQYLNLHFEGGNVLKLDGNAINDIAVGKTYCMDVVDDVVISYCEVNNE